MNKLIVLYFSLVLVLQAEMYDPFAKATKLKPTSAKKLSSSLQMIVPAPQIQLVVNAIMNNKAFINGEWYNIGDRINNQEITYIKNNFVGFKEENRLTMVSVTESNHVLSIKELQ